MIMLMRNMNLVLRDYKLKNKDKINYKDTIIMVQMIQWSHNKINSEMMISRILTTMKQRWKVKMIRGKMTVIILKIVEII